jgi:hypothetical protein
MMIKVATHPKVPGRQVEQKKQTETHTNHDEGPSTPSDITSDTRIRKYWQVTIDP